MVARLEDFNMCRNIIFFVAFLLPDLLPLCVSSRRMATLQTREEYQAKQGKERTRAATAKANAKAQQLRCNTAATSAAAALAAATVRNSKAQQLRALALAAVLPEQSHSETCTLR
jgi:hypothetical protein